MLLTFDSCDNKTKKKTRSLNHRQRFTITHLAIQSECVIYLKILIINIIIDKHLHFSPVNFYSASFSM